MLCCIVYEYRLERSTDQVMRALYRDALFSWANETWPRTGAPVESSRPEYLLTRTALEAAPPLRDLGYADVLALYSPGPSAAHSPSADRLPDYSRVQSSLLSKVQELFKAQSA